MPVFSTPVNKNIFTQGDKMKLTKLIVLVLLVSGVIFAQDQTATSGKPAATILKTVDDSVSYAIGQNIGNNLKDPAMNINQEILISALKDAFVGTSLLTIDQMKSVLNDFNNRLMAKKSQDAKVLAEKNKKAEDEFLEANKKKEGVVTTASGLQYKILVKGTGASPKDTSTVKVHYRGTLLNGKEFDSSYKRNEPAEFPVNQVIKGWTEALQLMHVGDKWELFIPSNLAYGDQGAGNIIEPGSTLIFEVELLDIVK
jgi:FKBP-type peptidyl-prolyl cis-trans isomerase FklB